MFIKAELYRVFKSTKSRVFILLIILIPVLDLVLNIQQNIVPRLSEEVLLRKALFHPAMAGFLSGANHGHIPQMLLVWLLPIHLLLIYGDSCIKEKSCGYKQIIFSQYSRKKIICTKFVTSFILCAGVIFVSLMLNFLMTNIVFHGGESFKGMEQALDWGILSDWFAWPLQNPTIAYFLYIIVYSVLAGGLGMMCYAVSLLVSSYVLAYPICFFLWYIQISSRYYSITYAIQPFLEYGPDRIVPALLIFFAITIISVLLSLWYVRRRDEY